MKKQDERTDYKSTFKGLLAFATIALALLSIYSYTFKYEKFYTCEDENGFDYIQVTCEHSFFPARLISPPSCSISYEKEGDWESSFSSSAPAEKFGNRFKFEVNKMFTVKNLDFSTILERSSLLFVEVDLDRYAVWTTGDFYHAFNNCQGDFN